MTNGSKDSTILLFYGGLPLKNSILAPLIVQHLIDFQFSFSVLSAGSDKQIYLGEFDDSI